MWIHVEQSTPIIQYQPYTRHVNVFCFSKPNSAPLSCPGICFLFLSSVSLSCLLSKDIQLHNFQSQGRQLGGQTAMESNIKLTFLFFVLNVNKEMLYRRNYKALENKVNHCGRMPGVDKWRRKCKHNISYLFSLLCSFPPLSSLFSFSLPYIPALSVMSLFSPCSPVSTAFPLVYCHFFSFSLSLCLSPSLTSSALSVKFYLWGVRGPGKLGVSWEKVSQQTTQNRRDWFNVYRKSAVAVEKIGVGLQSCTTREACLKFISSWAYSANPMCLYKLFQ